MILSHTRLDNDLFTKFTSVTIPSPNSIPFRPIRSIPTVSTRSSTIKRSSRSNRWAWAPRWRWTDRGQGDCLLPDNKTYVALMVGIGVWQRLCAARLLLARGESRTVPDP